MGTYTTNKELFMPSVGEQGWGDLVNGNFETIDNFLKPISLSGSTYTFTGNQTGGSISATSITNSGTLTNTGTSTFTGKITANGGIDTKALTATSISNSGTMTNTGTLTSTGKIYANDGLESTGDVIGNVVGNVTGNLNGCLYVNVSETATNTIGSCTVTVDTSSVSKTVEQSSGTKNITTDPITITNVTLVKKKGFEFDYKPNVKFTYSITTNFSSASTTANFKFYKNNVLYDSQSIYGKSTISTTLVSEVSEGDVFYLNVSYSTQGYSSRGPLTLSVSELDKSLYLG